MAEHRFCKAAVGGSIPLIGSWYAFHNDSSQTRGGLSRFSFLLEATYTTNLTTIAVLPIECIIQLVDSLLLHTGKDMSVHIHRHVNGTVT